MNPFLDELNATPEPRPVSDTPSKAGAEKPPDGYATWLDYAVAHTMKPPGGRVSFDRLDAILSAELAALRAAREEMREIVRDFSYGIAFPSRCTRVLEALTLAQERLKETGGVYSGAEEREEMENLELAIGDARGLVKLETAARAALGKDQS